MDRTGAFSYVYAKTCGILSRSFVDSRADSLFQIKKLSDLWGFLFDEAVPLLPEAMLAHRIEQKSHEEFVKTYIDLLNCFDSPDELLIACLQKYDYSNLKRIVYALRNHEKDLPHILDISPFSFLHTEKWPNLEAITENSPVSWLKTIPTVEDNFLWENRLDLQYYDSVWKCVCKLAGNGSEKLKDFVKKEIVYNNISWVLRLRVYFEMKPKDILPLLAYASDKAEVSSVIEGWVKSLDGASSVEHAFPKMLLSDELAGSAIQALFIPLDSYKDWEKWKYKNFLNPYSESEFWEVDPRWFERASHQSFSKMSIQSFREEPFTVFALYCFFVIKQHETALVRTTTEAIRLKVTEQELSEFRDWRG